MAEAGTFEEFVTNRSPAFLRLAYALTRDHTLAEDLLQTTLARSWPAWKRISSDPEPYVRRVLINTYSSWWRRRWNGERPTEVLPEQIGTVPQSFVDDRDEVWRALARLPKRQRAVLVLRYFEDLSEAQIAEALNMSPGTVKSYAAKGLAKLRTDPSLLTVPEAPAGVERLTAIKERAVQKRRIKLISAAAACLAILAVFLAVAAGGLFRTRSMEPVDPSPNPSGYLDGHRIVAGMTATNGDNAHFSWTPSTYETGIMALCTAPDEAYFMFLIVNGVKSNLGYGCQEDARPPVPSAFWPQRGDETYWREFGVELGQPADITFVISGTDQQNQPPAGTGHTLIWIGEKVDFAGFPLASRPQALAPLRPEWGGFNPEQAVMFGPGRPDSATLVRGRNYDFTGGSNTPGFLRVYVDGVLVHTLEWWDYQAGNKGFRKNIWDIVGPAPADGRQPTVTVTTEHLTGDWYLAITESRPQ